MRSLFLLTFLSAERGSDLTSTTTHLIGQLGRLNTSDWLMHGGGSAW
jgi:hypothetical protein